MYFPVLHFVKCLIILSYFAAGGDNGEMPSMSDAAVQAGGISDESSDVSTDSFWKEKVFSF